MKVQINLNELPEFAQQFWHYVKDRKVFAFHGAMGAGKTTTIKFLCKAKGVEDVIDSPSFAIINEYFFMEKGAGQAFYHIDLYRLKDLEEIRAAGVEDCLYSGAVCMVEWPEKAPELFDEHTMHIVITTIDEQKREIKILTAAEFNTHRLKEQL